MNRRQTNVFLISTLCAANAGAVTLIPARSITPLTAATAARIAAPNTAAGLNPAALAGTPEASATLAPSAAGIEQTPSAAASAEAAPAAPGAAFDGTKPTDSNADPVAALNTRTAADLAAFNNPTTRARVVFRDVRTNAERPVKLSLSALHTKIGSRDTLALDIHDLTYRFEESDAAKPRFDLEAFFAYTLLKYYSQDQVNQTGPDADKLVKEFIEQQVRDYESAVTVDAKVTHKDTDAAGNLTGLGLTLNADVDLTKLPAKVDPKNVLFTSVHAAAEMTLHGINLAMSLTFNPIAKQFTKSQPEFKAWLDALLTNDPEQTRNIVEIVRLVDKTFTRVANEGLGSFAGLFR